ncbi:biotin carboxylase N-terminal domain-containing protein [Aeromicrobium sp. CF4.19]|uniref:acetyl/propionyl/methylcrotonyl-CoA carboxylase subunit alpha n=1 Tax=Aeromicrobium sp. CF4.19 TaxID=3373082 RepID=UPI003EE66A5D
MSSRALDSRPLDPWPFDTVLVANRGEIARRVIRACREAGLRSVAVHSDADVDALHVREADAAVRLGPTAASESYLSIDRLVAAAVSSGAGAVHPGYGFLSENAAFARAVTEAGLVFIGPRADVMELMGRKDRAREVAERAGVPVTPRYEPDAVPDDAYPVLVKAAAGGGGKGMHVVRAAGDLADALALARREAAASFGDDTLLVEQYVEGGRHVEVQVFGDEHGNVVHLLERDCSAQRRHQKVVEEAPAPGLDPTLRALLHDSSVALCREVEYTGAGTVEFLVAAQGDGTQVGYFLEMNTRLQVEHPVTEQVTGLDLVQWQLDVAAGRVLPLAQGDVTATGHAVEVRVYAEDPYAGFLPQAGRVLDARWSPGRGQVHTAVEGEAVVTSSYDPMIAKLVGSGPDRDAAIDDVLAAIDDSAVVGIETNLGWLRRLVDSQAFRTGQVHTGWLDAHEGPLLERPDVAEQALRAAAHAVLDQRDASPFGRLDGWRSAGPPRVPVVVLAEPDGTTHDVVVGPAAATGASHRHGRRVWATWQGQTTELEPADAMRRTSAVAAGEADVAAPMPGTVVALEVVAGEVVVAGQRLGAVEAMKMELALLAPHDGTVSHVGAAVGDQVAMGHVVVHVSPASGADSRDTPSQNRGSTPLGIRNAPLGGEDGS